MVTSMPERMPIARWAATIVLAGGVIGNTYTDDNDAPNAAPHRRRRRTEMKVMHREWTIDSRPKRVGHHWHSWCEGERQPTDDGDDGQIFHFSGIGYFDTERAA